MSMVTTPPIPEAIRRIVDSGDRLLAWQFFVFFSRFEYALKRCSKYLKPTDVAKPNWELFSSDHNTEFLPNSSPLLASAVDYFKKYPPRKQKQADQQLTWSDPMWHDGKEALLVWLLRVVGTVRNNLFHGGKFPLIPVSDPSRDRDLLSHAIVILDACLMLDPSVQENFYDGLGD